MAALARIRPHEERARIESRPALAKELERLYAKYNRREFVHPDPLEFLYRYDDPRDREIAGLVASSLAYGRVKQILASVGSALDRMERPREFLERASPEKLRRAFAGFRHRFTKGEDLAGMLLGAKRAVERHGSLEACFMANLSARDETVIPALGAFVDELTRGARSRCKSFLPSPSAGSACKRLNLFLRWMVRADEVDPGGWGRVPASKLLVPLDTHMHRIGVALGFTRRTQPGLRAALEVTAAFRELAPRDPVRYDFALTRLGIRDDADADGFLKSCGVEGGVPKEIRRWN